METRTELILLQRTMVVVEGVARSLDPSLNMWTVAKPEVEDYIKTHLGPRAMIRDLSKAAMMLSRFGPKLPDILERILTQNATPITQKPKLKRLRVLSILLAATVFTAIGFGLAQLL
jgi:ubiquinone biosynthesis protein